MRTHPYSHTTKVRSFSIEELVDLIGTKDAAKELGVSHKWIKQWMKQNTKQK